MRICLLIALLLGCSGPAWTATPAELRRVSGSVKEHLPKARAATVALRTFSGLGSGVLISPEGLVLTAGHISSDPGRPVWAVLADGTQVRGRTLGLYPLIDSGMIRLEERDEPYPWVEMAEKGTVADNAWCFALGHPDGRQEERGEVLRIGRVLGTRAHTLRTDCRLLGGDSGGPLFNLDGEVIGIHSRIGFGGDENFHAPIDAYHTDWDALIAGEVIHFWPRHERGFLGVETARADKGVRINGVVAASPADDVGLRIDDRIIRVDGQDITDTLDFRRAVGTHLPKEKIQLIVERGDETLELLATLATWPDTADLSIRETPAKEMEGLP